MADRMEFTAKLAGILKVATEQDNHMTLEEVEKYFEEDQLNDEQMGLVCEYLMSQKITVSGYKQQAGSVVEQAEGSSLSQEEQSYVDAYLKEIAQMPEKTEEEAELKYYLPKVVEMAVELHEPGIYVGDLIQEGSISLMMALRNGEKEDAAGIVWEDEEEETENERESENENKNESESADIDRESMDAQILAEVRAGMQMMIESQTETKRQDKKMVHKVSELDEAIQNMTEEYGRKVAIDEVAEQLGMSEDEIADIMKLAGEEAPEEVSEDELSEE